MEIEYYGANCVAITYKKTRIISDDNLNEVGLKSISKEGDILINTGLTDGSSLKYGFCISKPGEYEISNVSIQGIAARSHMDEADKKSATIYKVIIDDMRIAVVGHIHPNLSEEQLEAIGTVDILIIPIGGNGYTLDGLGALKVIKEISPKLVIPTHFADAKIKYEVPQKELADSLKELSMEPKETTPKLKTKGLDLADTTQLIVLERQ